MKKVSRTNQFRRDLKLAGKQGLDLRKLDALVERRRSGANFDVRHHLHKIVRRVGRRMGMSRDA